MLKFAEEESGELCVTQHGTSLMLVLCAGNWAFLDFVRLRAITLIIIIIFPCE